MDTSYLIFIFLAVYFVAITVEAMYSHYHRKGLYELRDTVVNIALGTMAVLLRIATKGLWLAFWFFLYDYAPFKIEANAWSWVGLFFCNEFIYYWFHRLSHQYRILWAIHVNHHSSEKMNFSSAARVPFLNIFLHKIFWIPLLFIGFHPLMIFAVETISFLAAFMQHTQLIGRLGLLELVFNTPSHHRVHHASNPEYMNKNYGNVLIIFDRIFGTFKAEDPVIRPAYGLSKNIHSYNLLTVIFHEWHSIIRQGRTKKMVAGGYPSREPET